MVKMGKRGKQAQDKNQKKLKKVSLISPRLPLKRYRIIKLEEVKAHELKYTQILMDTKNCLDIIYEVACNAEKNDDNELEAKRWKAYVDCDTYPQSDTPLEVRAYKTNLKIIENKNVEETFNWMFSVDDRSILGERCAKDLTRRTLSNAKPQLGLQYDKMVGDYLEIQRRLVTFLRSHRPTTKIKAEVLKDALTLKEEIFKEVLAAFNSLTYRILSSGDAYMESLDPITEEYYFSGDNFLIHIWTLKNVPIRFTHIPEPRMVANLHNLKILLHIPYSMLRPNLCVQAVHMDLDIFSEYAKSFKLKHSLQLKLLNDGMEVLTEKLMREYEMQMEIQEKIRNEIVEAYRKHEEVVEKALNRLKKLKKPRDLHQNRKAEKKIGAIKGLIKSNRPQHLDDDEYPHIYAEFLKREQKYYEDLLNIAYHPINLDLNYDQINLRRFLIVGGVYQMNFVEKPLNVKISDCGMIWHSDKRKLVIEKDVRIWESSSVDFKSVPNTIGCLNCNKFLSPIDIVTQNVDPNHPLFVLIFHVPDYLCYWGEPIACHYEEMQEVVKNGNLEDNKREEDFIKLVDNTSTSSTLRSKLGSGKLSKLNDTLVKAHRINFHYSRDNYMDFSHITLTSTSLPDISAILKILDFPLDTPLTKGQLHLIEELCLPQMLSSYKFPKEIQEEVVKKTKGKRCLPQLSTEKKPQPGFGFDEFQNNPERVFMVFGKTRYFHVFEQLQAFQNILPTVPQTFYQLAKTLTLVRKFLQNSAIQIFRLKPFKPNMDFRKIRNKIKSNILKKKHEKLEKEKTKLRNFPRRDSSHKEKRESSYSSKRTSMEMRTSYKRESKRSSKELSMSRKTSVEYHISSYQKRKPSSKELEMPAKLKVDNRTAMKQETKPLSNEFDEVTKTNMDISVTPVNQKSKPFTKASASLRKAIISENTDNKLSGEILHEPKNKQTITFSHWTTKHIRYSNFIREQQIFMIETDRLGVFGFAFKRYEHFPFKYWTVQPSEIDPENEVAFTLDTQHVRCVLNINEKGIRGYVSEPVQTGKFVKTPKMYLVITDPIRDIAVLKKRFEEKNLNIFANNDASFYIENGYHSVKHVATENHTYYCMALHSTQMKFTFSQWNRLAERRDIILQFDNYKKPSENSFEVRVTPEGVTFVDVAEECSFTSETTILRYKRTWRNFELYSDLHRAVCSVFSDAINLRCRDSNLIDSLIYLLHEIRPLSYS